MLIRLLIRLFGLNSAHWTFELMCFAMLLLFAGKLVNVPLEQLPLLFKAVLHSCKSSLSSYRASLSPCLTSSSGN